MGITEQVINYAEDVVTKNEGKKFDEGKPRMSLIPSRPLMLVAQVLTKGAIKYDAHNWRKGMEWSRLIDATLRHILAFKEGEDLDPETGLPHTTHAICGLLFLTEYMFTHKNKDDRYKGETSVRG